MKLQFKHQKFQEDAAKAVVDVFAGQPYMTPSYRKDIGEEYQYSLQDEENFTGWSNAPLVPELTDDKILENIKEIQRANRLEPSMALEGKYNLTVEMETGVGKTYTYIKTMYELNKHYGWNKFIVVVPSIAVREGVFKSFQVTQEHFAEEYGKKIRFFIYNSAKLKEIDRFASDNSIHVMIINSQAFNAKGKDARRIYMKLDGFGSRRPIDVIAKTNPILIIDEPQSVEGVQTKERLKEFHPLMTLRYSATHRSDSIYNMIYRLDAIDAYNKRLVKKIAVKGISESGSTATGRYVFAEGIQLSESNPTAMLQFEYRTAAGIRKKSMKAGVGFNLYEKSGELEEYKDGFVVSSIDGRDDSVEFVNGIKLYAGEVIGKISEEHLRRIQIRETILSHVQRERALFRKGIKVLSLFFIDEVAKYRQYDEAGEPLNGIYADMFEEEYKEIIAGLQAEKEDEEYLAYLDSIAADKTHAGYFSVDKKGKMIDSSAGRKEESSDDVDAYDLIMKNKELLLDRDPQRSPVRFIFSHSALREGWDNPNVFQICTLKQSGSEIRKRQEVGRGLRLCVNQDGERMDINALGNEVHDINVLTVIASESYDDFAQGLQNEIAQSVQNRPKAVTQDLFKGKIMADANGNKEIITDEIAQEIYIGLRAEGYIDKHGILSDKYYEDKERAAVRLAAEAEGYEDAVMAIIDSVFHVKAVKTENARSTCVELQVDREKLQMPEFKELWSKISKKSAYVVNFDTEDLVKKAIAALNDRLHVPKIYFKVESGSMEKIDSKEELLSGKAFVKEEIATRSGVNTIAVSEHVKYDLIGKLVDETGLTRKTMVQILTGIAKKTFEQFKHNPEVFISRAAELINDEKAMAIMEHIAYEPLDEAYGEEVFTARTVRGKPGVNTLKTEKHLYDYLVYDSDTEKMFAESLELSDEVIAYVKLPDGFYISTPVGRYNPDWAIVFKKEKTKCACCVVETKGTTRSGQLRGIEEAKLHCAKEHFKAISGDEIVYEVADSYETLLGKIIK